jgi:hypothetical protein
MDGRFLLLDLNVNWNMMRWVTGATVSWKRERTRIRGGQPCFPRQHYSCIEA